MGPGKIEMKKSESASSRHVTFLKMRAGLFKNAYELSVLCDAEVAIILFSADGKLSEFASSNMESILRRFNTCLESRNLPTLEFKPEVSKEIDAVRQGKQELKLKPLKFLGKDLSHLALHELRVLEEQLTEGLLFIKERKMQLLMEHLEQSRKQEQLVLQENRTLKRKVEELQGFYPTGYPAPLSVYFPEPEGIVGPADRTFLPSTSFAAPLATDNTFLPSTSFGAPLDIDNGLETESKIGHADEEIFRSSSSEAPLAIDNTPFPSSSFASLLALDNGPETESKIVLADEEFFRPASSPAPFSINDGPNTECNIGLEDEDWETKLALAPTWGWSRTEDTRG